MLARELIALHESPHEVPSFSERYPGLTAAAGYEVARALHEHRVAAGWRPVGRKIGFTNRTIWPRYGVYEPIWGPVYDRTMSRAVHNRVGANVLGSPLAALAHLVGVLAKQPGAPALAAGEIVTTGVITDAHPVAPGELWSTRIAGLPLAGLTVEFA